MDCSALCNQDYNLCNFCAVPSIPLHWATLHQTSSTDGQEWIRNTYQRGRRISDEPNNNSTYREIEWNKGHQREIKTDSVAVERKSP